MSYNVHVAEADVRAGVFLRNDHFALVTRLLKLETDAAISRAIGMDRITISRARDGILGERFIAAVMFLVGQHADELATFGVSVKFEDLFEVSRVKAASA